MNKNFKITLAIIIGMLAGVLTHILSIKSGCKYTLGGDLMASSIATALIMRFIETK